MSALFLLSRRKMKCTNSFLILITPTAVSMHTDTQTDQSHVLDTQDQKQLSYATTTTITYSFFGFADLAGSFVMKNWRSTNLRTSSMPLEIKVSQTQREIVKRGLNLHDRRTDRQHRLPLTPVQRRDGEQTLQERDVQQREVQNHAERDSVHKHHVLPQR